MKTTLATCLDQMVCAVRVKIAQVRAEYPGKAVILIGWGTGSSIACQVILNIYILLFLYLFLIPYFSFIPKGSCLRMLSPGFN